MVPVQLVAFAELHESEEFWPRAMVEGLAERETVGVGITETEAEQFAVRPLPENVPVYVVLDEGVTAVEPFVLTLPTVGEIVPDEAFVDDQLNVAVCP